MTRPLRISLLLSSGLLAVACGSSLEVPIEPGEVRITLSVSGGFEGIAYTVVLDGESGELRGGACSAPCDWQPGDVLRTVPHEEIGELARDIEAAGIFDLDGHDFGDACCDMFHVVLTYERAGRSSTVEGTDELYPDRLAEAIGILSGMVHERAAVEARGRADGAASRARTPTSGAV